MARWIHRYNETGDVRILLKSGPNKIITREQEQILIEEAKSSPFDNSFALANKANIRVNQNTKHNVRRRLLKAGIKSRRAARQCKLNAEHIEKRLIFCRLLLEHLDESDFNQMVFTDEKTFSSDPKQRKIVWREKSQRFHRKCISEYRLSGYITEGMWATIGREGLITPLIRTGPHFNAQNYKIVLEHCIAPVLNENHIYIQDNSRIHKNHYIEAYLASQPFVTISLPPFSPDLNLIENLWDETTRNWNLENRSRANLNNEIQKRWTEVENKPRE